MNFLVYTPEPPIRKNAVFCYICQEEVESKHRHDFRGCACGQVFVDGGTAYRKRTYLGTYWEERT